MLAATLKAAHYALPVQKAKYCLTAAAAGAYLHARIGDLLYKEKGYHVIASDVVDYIPKILKGFDRTIG